MMQPSPSGRSGARTGSQRADQVAVANTAMRSVFPTRRMRSAFVGFDRVSGGRRSATRHADGLALRQAAEGQRLPPAQRSPEQESGCARLLGTPASRRRDCARGRRGGIEARCTSSSRRGLRNAASHRDFLSGRATGGTMTINEPDERLHREADLRRHVFRMGSSRDEVARRAGPPRREPTKNE